MGKLTATAIIPVLNEQKTVKGVVKAVLGSGLFNEVIVVNDGSTDKTPAILKTFGNQIQVVSFVKNRGKGYALAAGIKKAASELVVFLDGDAVTLSSRHLQTMLKPFENGKTRVVIGHESVMGVNYPTFLQGERAYFRRDLLPHLTRMKCTRFGVELFLEELRKRKRWPVKHVHLKGFKKIFKFDKTGISQQTLKDYLQEAWEITQELARSQKATARQKVAMEKMILRKMLKNYLKTSKKLIKEVLATTKKFKKLRMVLKDIV
jgi:glycosyltransferase involved in cell wall biosynthesis